MEDLRSHFIPVLNWPQNRDPGQADVPAPNPEYRTCACRFRLARLLPFKHEDVWRNSACGVDGHRQGLAIGRKRLFLGTCDFVADLGGYFQSALADTPRRGRSAGGRVRAHTGMILAVERYISGYSLGRIDERKTVVHVRLDLNHIDRVQSLAGAFPRAGKA